MCYYCCYGWKRNRCWNGVLEWLQVWIFVVNADCLCFEDYIKRVRFGPTACPSTRPFVCPALLVPKRLVSHAPATARAVYSGRSSPPVPAARDRPSEPRPWSHIATILLLYIDCGRKNGRTLGQKWCLTHVADRYLGISWPHIQQTSHRNVKWMHWMRLRSWAPSTKICSPSEDKNIQLWLLL